MIMLVLDKILTIKKRNNTKFMAIILITSKKEFLFPKLLGYRSENISQKILKIIYRKSKIWKKLWNVFSLDLNVVKWMSLAKKSNWHWWWSWSFYQTSKCWYIVCRFAANNVFLVLYTPIVGRFGLIKNIFQNRTEFQTLVNKRSLPNSSLLKSSLHFSHFFQSIQGMYRLID